LPKYKSNTRFFDYVGEMAMWNIERIDLEVAERRRDALWAAERARGISGVQFRSTVVWRLFCSGLGRFLIQVGRTLEGLGEGLGKTVVEVGS
jgi:hypothetical protein